MLVLLEPDLFGESLTPTDAPFGFSVPHSSLVFTSFVSHKLASPLAFLTFAHNCKKSRTPTPQLPIQFAYAPGIRPPNYILATADWPMDTELAASGIFQECVQREGRVGVVFTPSRPFAAFPRHSRLDREREGNRTQPHTTRAAA